ncbi:MAG TPA: zf-HC2 domain-containing protein [Solirubrobacteraceae bacterium]|nr:zf-HC2 domain-containing protein [Solirubrobacteraceae bacterium]
MLDHRFTKAHASEYLDGDLPESGRHRVERHTSICPQCRELIASLRRMLEALPALGAQPQPTVADGVLERLRREP